MVAHRRGRDNRRARVFGRQETLELAGLIVLVDTLLLYLGQRVGSVGMQLEESDESLTG